MVDLDADGNPDVLSGSWPGEIHLFRGKGKGEFAAPERLRNRDGKLINAGGGILGGSVAGRGEMVLFAGDAATERGDKGTVIVYDGARIEVPAGREVGITGTASAVHAFDWDGDGDLDLVVGEIDGRVWLVPNEGTPKAWAFGKEVPLRAGGIEMRVGHDAGPFVADWDGDGLPDLLVGAGDGSVTLFRNAGRRKAPELATGTVLVAPGEARYGADAPASPTRGARAKVCAADWNGDGRLDLLLGDIEYLKADLPEATGEEKARQDGLRKDLEGLRKRYAEIAEKLGDPGVTKDEKEKARLEQELADVERRMWDLQDKLPRECENHGFVWLFLRKPSGAGGAAK